MNAYLRADGGKGIRNVVAVVYLVECAHHVAREIAAAWHGAGHGAGDPTVADVHVIGFAGCYPNAYAQEMLERLCTHPNTGAVLLVSLGCEGFDNRRLRQAIAASGRPVALIGIQAVGGTRRAIETGRAWVAGTLADLETTPTGPIDYHELVVGTICGGSDGTSGLSANPAIGRAFDLLVEREAACLFTETGELIGCEDHMAARARTPELAGAVRDSVARAATHDRSMGHGSFAPGNAEGGLTTQEEKSMGAYAKSGASRIGGVVRPGVRPPRGGLYLLDDAPDPGSRFGYAQINDTTKIGELIACGAHLILFSTGRGSVVGSAISPVIKVCANPDTYRRMAEDMDCNAGRIIDGEASLDEVGRELFDLVDAVACGQRTCSEALGHREFVLSYKSFGALGPGCLPAPA